MHNTMLRTIFALTGSFLALASCSAGSGAPFGSAPESSANVNLIRPSTSQGGSFKASYSGNWNIHTGQCGTFCDRWKFHGTGTATFLGSSRESGAVQGGFGTGNAVLRESSSKQDFIRVHISGAFCSPHLAFTVSGGKGMFKDATGSGTIHFSCTGTKRGSYNDNWSGTIYY
jgi:hypothetical protein